MGYWDTIKVKAEKAYYALTGKYKLYTATAIMILVMGFALALASTFVPHRSKWFHANERRQCT